MEKLHSCTLHSPEEAYGVAIDECDERPDGTLWAGNGEYGSQVNFCPACGYKAVSQIKLASLPEPAKSLEES